MIVFSELFQYLFIAQLNFRYIFFNDLYFLVKQNIKKDINIMYVILPKFTNNLF